MGFSDGMVSMASSVSHILNTNECKFATPIMFLIDLHFYPHRAIGWYILKTEALA
jgi:hypothetical protein